MIRYWIRIWDCHEHPLSLALIRIALGLVVLSDFLHMMSLDLVIPLMGEGAIGGFPSFGTRDDIPLWYQLFPVAAGSAYLLWGALVASLVGFTAGIFPRISAVAFVLLSTQFSHILPGGDRAIDTLIRNVMLILACSQMGRTLSVQARVRNGRWWGDGQDVPAWPRHLIILQLVIMYFLAGIQKFGLSWTPLGGYSALYIILQDWAVARISFAWLADQPFYFLTQLASAITVLWQWSYPMVLVLFHFRLTPERGGRLREWTVKHHLHLWWMALGGLFHVLIGATMELGIFPTAMLATYFAFVHPEEWREGRQWLRRKTGL